jgi:16S rRNA (guanine527-N7)-methyltransferase
MTEAEARDWIVERHGAPAADRIGAFLDLVRAENTQQNLVAPSTVPHLWMRHALDSAQLLAWDREGLWLDVGTGGGFPGVVVSILRDTPVLLVEPRRKRAAFLQHCIDLLGLSHVRVSATKVDGLAEPAAVISARAVAPIENLLQIAKGCATKTTRWLLPRGRSAAEDLASLHRNWRGMFHVEHSLTDPESSILVLDGVSRR